MYVESEKCGERCGRMQKIQLICFPYAGGSAAFFHGLKEELQDQIEVTAAEYAGHMFVASHRPPHLPLQGNLNADSSEVEVIEALCNFGGMDPRLLENKRFLNLFIRPVKVDYGLLLQYQAAEVPEKVTCDLTAFYASEDLTAEEVCQWQRYTEGEFTQYEFPGNHFFLKENEKPVGDVIREKLLSY